MLTLIRTLVATPSILHKDSGTTSSIAKRPVLAQELRLTRVNLDGDDQADRRVHGGPDKAVYAYPIEHLEHWASELQQPDILEGEIAPFGENFSVSGALESDVHIGDTWTLGTAVLQVCQPRWPCGKLTMHRRTNSVGTSMRQSGRTGWYLRVLQPGSITTSGPIGVDPHPAAVSVLEAHLTMTDRHNEDPARLQRVLAVAALADEWRLPLVERQRT